MIQVQFEVRSGATRFRVSARAVSMQRALSVAGARYPGGEVQLVTPVDPETSFAEAASGEAALVEVQWRRSKAEEPSPDLSEVLRTPV